jgi:integrase
MYLAQRISYGISADKHPFLFVSHHGEYLGEPYTMSSFREALARAVQRIGMGSSKAEGTTEHGHRHAYGQRATRGDLGVSVIQAGMHHASPESQEVYTAPSITHVTQKMAQAAKTLEDPFNFASMLALSNK